MNCPNNHGQMKVRSGLESVNFRGKTLEIFTTHYVCSQCGIKVDDIPFASKNQKALAEAYRLAGREIGKTSGD